MTGPAKDKDHPFVTRGDVEVGECDLGGAPAGICDALLRSGRKGLVDRFKAVGSAIVAPIAVQDVLLGSASLEPRVDGLDVAQNGGVGHAGVFEVQGPFHRGEIQVLDGVTANKQTCIGGGIRERVLHPPGVQPLSTAFQTP